MKNLSVSNKLYVGFGILLALMVLSSALSIIGISTIGNQVDLYSQYTVPHSNNIWTIRRNIVSAQRYIARAILEENESMARILLESASEDGEQALAALEEYAANQRDSSRNDKIDLLRDLLTQSGSVRRQITELLQNPTETNKKQAYKLFLNSYLPPFEEATEILNTFTKVSQEHAAQQKVDADNAKLLAISLLMGSVVISILIAAFVVIAIRRSILTPVKRIMHAYKEMSEGNMQAEVTYESRDELGQMAALIHKTNAMQNAILSDLIDKLAKLSKGDLQIRMDLEYPGDFALLKNAFEDTIRNLNATMQTIQMAAEQVSTGAYQMASGAEALATGSTEQASSIEELNESIGRIATQAEDNSANVTTATRYVEQAVEGVNNGNQHMVELTEAMESIGTASDQISNITKAIEDIAFQTNILALNAAIEAARAGSAGKGFAVVADEVRALAAKSAEAAKKTAELIEASVQSISKGIQMTRQTAGILQDVGSKAHMVNESIVKIERATLEQADAIETIKYRLEQVSAVIQTNAATAEENSATSEEMSAQAATLREEVAKFKLL